MNITDAQLAEMSQTEKDIMIKHLVDMVEHYRMTSDVQLSLIESLITNKNLKQ